MARKNISMGHSLLINLSNTQERIRKIYTNEHLYLKKYLSSDIIIIVIVYYKGVILCF